MRFKGHILVKNKTSSELHAGVFNTELWCLIDNLKQVTSEIRKLHNQPEKQLQNKQEKGSKTITRQTEHNKVFTKGNPTDVIAEHFRKVGHDLD